MKKTPFLLTLLFAFIGLQVTAQVLNQAANWPNTNWVVTGTYNTDPLAFEADPTLTANFAFDDDDSGSGNTDAIQAESPIIDLTAAFTAGETWLFVNSDYVYNWIGADSLGAQYWDADAGTWNNWGAIIQADTATPPTGDFCSGNSEPFNSDPLNIAGFTATQLSGFKYRIFYDDGGIWAWGFCFNSPTITSQTPPTCPDISGLTATTTGDSTADITWVLGSTETNWQIWVQPAGTGMPTTDGAATMLNAPYPATGLTASTAYEVYVRADCGADGFSNWIGPVNFTTFNVPPPSPVGVTCNTGNATTVFTEGFGTDPDVDPAGWTGTGFDGANGNWDITNPAANSADTGPANTYDGNPGVHLEYEASGNSTDIASAISPAIDLTTATDGAELAFFMHAFGGDLGTLNVNVGTNPAGPFTTEYTWIGDYQANDVDPWVPIGVNLDAYLGQVIYLEFSYGATGNGWEGDMSIDQITVETCGNFCIAPSNIMAANITNTNADISWTANNGEAQWEYVIQPAGTGMPTGAGTITNTPGFPAMGLTGLTAYEVYVLADCGGSQSIWAGPFNFTTDVQLNFVVDCVAGPTNFNYCYDSNDPNVFTFTSSDGSPLNFTINSGDVEGAPWDFLVVTNSDGTEMYNGEGNNGDLSGLTFQSTGDSISFNIISDGSVSCQSSANINPLDITVSCATCINPAATYQVVDDCANGNQFLVDVDITSLGDATSLSIEDNQGNAPVSISATGITQFGPYPFNTDIIFTISNEQDGNCVIVSPAFQLAACPPVNDNCDDATVAVVNDSFLCEMSTPGTLQEATPSGIANPSCGGDPDDDVWFQFVATSEFQLIALANIQGSLVNNIDHAVYSGTCGALTEISCTTGFTLLSSVTPQLVIGDTYYIRVFSNNSNAETTTFDLCITPYVAPTNITCDASENLCPGAGDLYSYNTINIIPGLGNIDCLGSSPNPTFSLIEIGTSGDINIEMVQNTAFDSLGNAIGDELDVDFALWGPFNAGDDYCNGGDYPSTAVVGCSYSAAPIENFVINGAVAGDIYIVLITNFEGDPGIIQINQTNFDPNNPDPNAGTLSAEINVELISNDTVFVDVDNDDTTPAVANLCGYNSITLDANSPFADVFEWSVNGIFDPSLTGSSIVVTESDTYSVTAYDTQCMGNASATVVVNLYQEAIVNIVPPEEISIVTCDDESGDGVEDFNLDGLSSIILNSPGQNETDFLVTYHETLNDAQTGSNAIASPYSATDGTIIYVRVEDVDSVGSGSGCASTNTSFELVVLGALPTITGVEDLRLCDDESRDETEAFNLEENTSEILNGQDPAVFVVSYHASQADADAGVNALASPYNNTSNPQPIYARLQNNAASDCYKTTTFNLIVQDIPVTTFDASIVYEVCPNATVPITVTAMSGNYMESDVSIQWFYEGVLISGQTDLTLDTVLLAGDYEIAVTFNATGCSSIAAVEVLEFETCVIPQGISPGTDGMNDTFDLSSYDVQSLTIFNRYGVKVYEKTNYTNQWHGQSLDGDELPVGTYYYIMNYQGTKTKAAWVYINRESK